MATGSKVQPPIPPITYSKYERMLDTIQFGKDEEAIKLFSSGQFDVNVEVPYLFEDRKKYQVTPLHWAVRYHKPKLCKFLLSNGANPYNTLVYEYYPLHEACNRGYEDIVKVFIDAMVDINRVTNDLDTPLHIACTRGNIQCVHLLLGCRADSKMQNKAGHTPLEAALYHNHQDLVQLFKTYGITLGKQCCCCRQVVFFWLEIFDMRNCVYACILFVCVCVCVHAYDFSIYLCSLECACARVCVCVCMPVPVCVDI